MNAANEQLDRLDQRRGILRNYARMVLDPQDDLLQRAMQDYEQFLLAELLPLAA